MTLPSALSLSGPTACGTRGVAGRRALHVALLVGGVFALGLLCGQRAEAAEVTGPAVPSAGTGPAVGHPAPAAPQTVSAAVAPPASPAALAVPAPAAPAPSAASGSLPPSPLARTAARMAADAEADVPSSLKSAGPGAEATHDARPRPRAGAPSGGGDRLTGPLPGDPSVSGFRLRNDRDTRPVRLADTNLVADPVIVTSTELDLTGPARRTDHTDLPGLPDAGGPPSADGGDTARPGPVLPVLPSLTTRPLLPLPLALPLPAPVTDGPVPGGPAAAAPGDGSGSEASGTGTPQDDTAHHRRPRTAPAPLPTAGLSGDRSAPAAHAAPPAPLRQDPQNPAGEPDGTLGHRAATDGGTSRCGDALALTGPHRPPLVLAPGAAARADADGTRDRYRDVPVSPA